MKIFIFLLFLSVSFIIYLVFKDYLLNSELTEFLALDKEKLFRVFNVYKKDISKYIEIVD